MDNVQWLRKVEYLSFAESLCIVTTFYKYWFQKLFIVLDIERWTLNLLH